MGKRLIRSSKVFVRDSGLVHALLGLNSLDAVLSHLVAGSSWEGFVVEQLINTAPTAQSSFYRTSNGAEVDLVLEFRGAQTWAIEIKRSSVPTVSKGFYTASADLGAVRKSLVAVSRTASFHEGRGRSHERTFSSPCDFVPNLRFHLRIQVMDSTLMELRHLDFGLAKLDSNSK